MARTIEQRREALQLKQIRMQAIVNMRAEGRPWKEIAEACNLNNHQRAMQLYQEALANNIVPEMST